MSQKDVIRLAVGHPGAIHSSIWRIWVQGDEIYVAAREYINFIKFSLHSSGIYRFASVKERDLEKPLSSDSDPRVMGRWTRPKPFKKGWTQCMDIYVPSVKVIKRFSVKKFSGFNVNVKWIPKPKILHKIQVTFLLAENESQDIMSILKDDDTVLGSLVLRNSKKLWVVSHIEIMGIEEAKYTQNLVNKMNINYKENPGGVFATVFDIDTGSPYPKVTNVALGRENIYVKDRRILK